MAVTIYHNPRCSKSRATLALLEARGIAPEIVLYLENPPGGAELDRLLTLLGMEPRDLMRTQEPEYRAQNLDDPGLGRDDLIRAMVRTPILIERPIVVVDGERAVLGRPPEKALEIL
jgi:arsenate reductase